MITLIPAAFCLAISIAPPTQGPAAQGPRDQGPEATYYFLLARYLEGSGKIDDAVAALRQAMALDPRSAEPRAELAGLYARQDKAAEALTAAEDALTVDPKNQEANRILGSVRSRPSRSRAATAPAICQSISRSGVCISTRIAPPMPSRSSGGSSSNSRSMRTGPSCWPTRRKPRARPMPRSRR